MAHTFKIVDNTSSGGNVTLVDFMDSDHGIVSYFPGYGTEDTITETATVRVKASTDSGLSAALSTISNTFVLAENRRKQNEVFYNIRLNFSPSGADTGFSPLYGGRIISIENMLDTPWTNLELNVTMEFTRANYWEGAWAYATTSTHNGSATSGYIVVYNNTDATGSSTAGTYHQNYVDVVDINGLEFPTDLPYNVKIRIVPDTAQKIAGIYCMQYYEDARRMQSSEMPELRGWFEGENASTAAHSTGAAYSGGAYQAFTVSTGTTGINIAWPNYAHFVSAYNKLYCGAKFTGTVRIRPYAEINSVKTYGATVIHTGSNTWKVYDLGVILYPPIHLSPADYTVDSHTYDSLQLGINVVCVAGTTFNLDWFSANPVNSSFYAKITENYALGSTDTDLQQHLHISYLGDKLWAYVLNNASGKIKGKSAAIGSIELTQGHKNTLHFIFEDETGVIHPQQDMLLNVQYAPRWRYFNAA